MGVGRCIGAGGEERCGVERLVRSAVRCGGEGEEEVRRGAEEEGAAPPNPTLVQELPGGGLATTTIDPALQDFLHSPTGFVSPAGQIFPDSPAQRWRGRGRGGQAPSPRYSSRDPLSPLPGQARPGHHPGHCHHPGLWPGT